MPAEIERKFLGIRFILAANSDWKRNVNKEIVIKQGYLSSNPDRTVRVRVKGKRLKAAWDEDYLRKLLNLKV